MSRLDEVIKANNTAHFNNARPIYTKELFETISKELEGYLEPGANFYVPAGNHKVEEDDPDRVV